MRKMDSPLSGSKEGVLVAIESEQFNLYIKGKQPEFTKLSEEDLAYYELSSEALINVSIAGVYEEKASALSLKAAPLFFEQTAYEIVIEEMGEEKITFDHDSPLIRNKVTPLGKRRKMQTGVINFGNEVGLSEFRILVGGSLALRFVLEVYPTKLSYKADYWKLQEEITEELYNLAYDFMKQTYQSVGLQSKSRVSLTEFFSIYKIQFKHLKEAISLITYRPYHQLIEEVEIQDFREGMPMGKKGIYYLNKHPNQLIKGPLGLSAKKVLVTRKQHTVDIYENQVVKFMLEQILRKLKSVKLAYLKLDREKDEQVLTFLNEQIMYMEQQLESHFFRSISKLNRPMQFSLVIQMSPIYRKFYKIYLALQRGLSLSSDIFQISYKNVAELYEYWCFIKLGALLRKYHPLKGNDVIKADSKGLYVSLKKGKTSTLSFIHSKTGETFSLSYNRSFNSNPTVSQKPDNMLLLQKEMSGITYHYVLDAKYKLDYEEVDGQRIEVPRKEDINTLHRYRDAIVSSLGEKRYEQVVFGGVILFPGGQEQAYTTHDFYQSIAKVNIGGLPFLPAHTQLVETFLEDLVEGTGHSQYSHLPLTIGTKDYLEDLNIATKNVLIAPVKSAHQLSASLENRLYHMPQSALKVLNKQIETIVLYEPKGKEGLLPDGGIRYEGKVKSAKAVPRKELRNLFPMTKDNEEEIYIVYEVSKWKERKHILRSTRYSPVRKPRYSNTTLLTYAQTLPELYIKDELEFNLILQLRRTLDQLTTGIDEHEKLEMTIGNVKIKVNDALKIIVTTSDETRVFEKELFERRPRVLYDWIKSKSNKGVI